MTRLDRPTSPGVPGPRGAGASRRGPLPSVPTAVLAAATLVLGFAVAELTGVRALGGVVLAGGVAWCAARSVRSAGVLRVAAVVALGAVCFVASHVVAGSLGAWPSVVLAAAVLAAGTALLVDRRA
ncbi:hypothetical protein [Cellulomonas hominis]|uniref:hypothetical protein n=1 Tax=Cellulomonas hominis TaxID=156981 RepID=UPI0027E0E0D8|nr:hypothetical protein [Cellulomonas hominis]